MELKPVGKAVPVHKQLLTCPHLTLGPAVDRETRPNLQIGGCYFVDMQAHVSHPLGTVETGRIPHETNIPNSK